MSKRVLLDVWDAMNKEYVALNVTVDGACTIIGCKYNTIMAHRKDERLIKGRYIIREAKQAIVEKPAKKTVQRQSAEEKELKTLGQWAEDWERIRRGALMLKTGMGVVRRSSDGNLYVYSKKCLSRGGSL